MFSHLAAVTAILGMSAVTLLTRYTGYLLVGRFAVRGRLAAALEAMPGAMLISIIAPSLFLTGPAEAVSGLVTGVISWRWGMLPAIIGGVLCVVALRAYP